MNKRIALLLCFAFTFFFAMHTTPSIADTITTAPEVKVSKVDGITANVTEEEEKTEPSRSNIRDIMAGDYLASRFAQSQHDWNSASDFITPLISSEIPKEEVIQRAMVIAMGAGETKRAIELAHKKKDMINVPENTIADIFLITEAFKNKNYKKAEELYDKLNNDSTVSFVGPFIKGWLEAANGKLNITNLNQNTVQLYHAILISDYLNNHDEVEKMIDTSMKVEDISLSEIERVADLYGHVGLKEKAITLYKTILENNPNDEIIKNKISNLEKGATPPIFEKVKDAHHGMAQAFHDIAMVLYSEQNDESARVFANLSKYLTPDLTDSTFLLAEINSRHEQFDKAIELYKSINKNDKNYEVAQFSIVNIYDQTEQYDKALSILNSLSKKETSPEILIRIGDLYRHQSNYKKSIELYSRAIKSFNGNVPSPYWHVYYVRGIANEQSGHWDAAEKDLQTALKYQPDHPYVLNYLGYSWADRGMHLEKATSMIKKAVEARPTDGFITDSLGWVMYRNGNYKRAVPVLERAIELLPYDPTVNDHLGDAYWQVGRKMEARFQWERAKNNSTDDTQIKAIEAKLETGVVPLEETKTISH